ncbi:MAG: TolC family protein [Candidatus Omnitrophota bacterium]
MKKDISPPRWLAVFPAVTLGLGLFSFSPLSAFADERLSTFQQEIIAAKEKQHAISAKMGAMEELFEEQRGADLDKEAKRLMEDLVGGGYSSSQEVEPRAMPKLLFRDKAIQQFRLVPRKAPAVKPEGPQWPWLSFVDWRKKLAGDGAALYKTALSDDKLTIREAVDIGLANNVSLQSLKKKIEVAEAKLVEAKRALFPTVQLLTEENQGLVSKRFYKGRNYKVNLTQPLFYGGELVYTVKQAEENLKSSKLEHQKAKNGFIHEVRTSYLGVVKAEYNVQYQIQIYEKLNNYYKRAREEKSRKLIPEVDYLNIESRYYEVFYQLESAKSDLLAANLVLRSQLTLNPDDAAPVDLRLRFRKVGPAIDDMVKLALQGNPDILIKQAAVESAIYGVRVFQAKKYPHTDLRGSYGMLGEIFKDTKAIEDDNHDLDLEKEWFLGVHVTMPLGPHSVEYDHIKHVYGPTVLALTGSEDWRRRVQLNLFDKLSDVTDEKGAQAALLQAQADLNKVRDDVILEVREEFYDLRKTMIQIDASAAKVRYKDKQVAILEYLLGHQETTVDNVWDEMIEQAQNKYAFIQAVTDYELAISSMAVSIGDPYYFETETE